MLILRTFGSLAIVAVLSHTATAQAPVCLWVTAPSYFYPGPGGSEWDTLLASAPHTRNSEHVLIINPNSGPGRVSDPAFRNTVAAAHKSGQKVYGYVPTGYGKVELQTAEHEVQKYASWYGVDGIFVDEVSAEVIEAQRYYQPLASMITSRIKRGGVTLNHGTYPDSAYARIQVPVESKLQLVVFEHDYSSFTQPSYAVPSWVRQYPASMFVGIVYAAPREAMQQVLQLSAERNIGSVYITDKTLPNPYNALPTYWSALNETTQSGCKQR